MKYYTLDADNKLRVEEQLQNAIDDMKEMRENNPHLNGNFNMDGRPTFANGDATNAFTRANSVMQISGFALVVTGEALVSTVMAPCIYCSITLWLCSGSY